MQPTPYLRASDADREAAVDRLRRAAVEGRLDADELEQRVAAAYAARWIQELERLTADVTPPAPVPPPAPAPYGYVAPVAYAPAPSTNGLAIASLVAGITWIWWLGSIAAVIFGHIALGQISRSGGYQAGRGLAIAGLVLGYIGIATMLFTIVVVAAS